jgi:hypothetical protein
MEKPQGVALYRTVLGISLGLNVAVGIFILVAPDAFAALLRQPQASPETWPRHWGAQLIAINLLYLPGWKDPVRNRFVNYLGIVIRLTFAVFLSSQGDGFVPMGMYDAAFGAVLLACYLRTPRPGAPRAAA